MRNYGETCMGTNTSLDACREAGSRHAGYEWARSPYGHWNQEQREAYFQAYDQTREQNKTKSKSCKNSQQNNT